MQEREKKLAAGLGVVLVVAFGLPLLEGWFLQPITDARNELAVAQETVATLTESEDELKLARRNLEDWRYESLPPNPFTAQREYQEWLMDVARMSGLRDPVATLGNVPVRGRVYNEIPVTIEARATFAQLARFLYHFERVSLLHRVHSLDVVSPASIGNPLLNVTIVARGLSLVDAPERLRLFPTTRLQEDLSAEATAAAIEAVKGFPSIEGFQIKIGTELLVVRHQADAVWTVQRGAEETVAAAHPAGSIVELFPMDRSWFQSGRSFEDFVELLSENPFTKPSPPIEYAPELAPAELQTVTRGESWSLPLTLDGWDPAGGPAEFRLGDDAPHGMTIDPSTGELAWDPGPDVEAKRYEVAIVAQSSILSDQLVELTLPIMLREPNLPPTIDGVDALTAYSGRPLTFKVQADDPDGDNSQMTFSLVGEVPEGARIDERGELTWIPPLTLELKEYKLTVSVADSGDPQQTTTQDVTVKLEDDAALFTRLVGFFENDGRSEAMLTNLTSGVTTRVAEGGEIHAADVNGTIVGIAPRHLVLQVGDEEYKLEMGQNLRQMTLIETAEGTPAAESGS